jgi:hypothetical protein
VKLVHLVGFIIKKYVNVTLNVGLKGPKIGATQHSRSAARGLNLCDDLYTSRALTFRVTVQGSALKLQDLAVRLLTFF